MSQVAELFADGPQLRGNIYRSHFCFIESFFNHSVSIFRRSFARRVVARPEHAWSVEAIHLVAMFRSAGAGDPICGARGSLISREIVAELPLARLDFSNSSNLQPTENSCV